MSSRNARYASVAGVVVLAVVAIGLAVGGNDSVRKHVLFSQCKSIEMQDEQIDCIFRIIEDELHRGGIALAMDAFASAYTSFNSFASTGCHRHAHRVGDMAYYGIYFGTRDLSKMDFPQETTACGYGFFHGFIEHLIQDNPDPDFVTDVCEGLRERYEARMRDIATICYHGSGHGFTLAHAETLRRNTWSDIVAFAEAPLHQCEKLSRASENEKEDCRQGVFNVIVDWMEDEEYGFRYNTEKPFGACDRLATRWRHACYYEAAQKLGLVATHDPRTYAAIAERIDDEKLRRTVFEVAVAGIVQAVITDENGYRETLAQCEDLDQYFFELCVTSMVWGLFEHGMPQWEYRNVLHLCAERAVEARSVRESCYQAAAGRLPRFYTAERIARICREFPEDARGACELKL